MAKKVEIPFTGQAYNLIATQIDAQNCINWYLTLDATGKGNKPLLPRAGLSLYMDDDNETQCRGMFQQGDVLYYVIDASFYIGYKNETRKKVGTLNTTLGNVSIIGSNVQIFITDGQNGYIYQLKDSATRSPGDFFPITNASSTIGTPVFAGTGINDLSASGTYTGEINRTYRIEIDSTGGLDTFRWSDDNGNTYVANNVQITGGSQLLNNGVFITFINTSGHTLNDAWTVTISIDSAFYAPVIAAHIDGYGLYPRQGTNRFYISTIDDFSQVDALDYATANTTGDNIVAVKALNGEVWIFSEYVTTLWYNTGNLDFPFGERTNLVINYGCQAPFSIQVGINNIIFLLTQNKEGDSVVGMIDNYSMKLISTEPINTELRTYERIDDAYSSLVERNGHLFYILTFPTADRTWVYDVSTSMWHEWRSYNPTIDPQPFLYDWGIFRGKFHASFDGHNVFGDTRTGKLFRLDEGNFQDYDVSIVAERTCQHISSNGMYERINLLQIDVESGVGLTTGQGETPQLMLQVSRDGGKSWGAEMWRSAGKIGKYKNRALWYRLGTARVFTFRLRISDPVFKVIIKSNAEIDAGD